jgi:hypothetical protein
MCGAARNMRKVRGLQSVLIRCALFSLQSSIIDLLLYIVAFVLGFVVIMEIFRCGDRSELRHTYARSGVVICGKDDGNTDMNRGRTVEVLTSFSLDMLPFSPPWTPRRQTASTVQSLGKAPRYARVSSASLVSAPPCYHPGAGAGRTVWREPGVLTMVSADTVSPLLSHASLCYPAPYILRQGKRGCRWGCHFCQSIVLARSPIYGVGAVSPEASVYLVSAQKTQRIA